MTVSLIHAAGTQDNHNVIIHDLGFNPRTLTISKGDTVNWTDNDPLVYTLWFTFEENGSTYLLSDPILPGQSWSHTFIEQQRFTLFYCDFDGIGISNTIRVYLVVGDVDGDSDVDIHDLYLFAKSYDTMPPANPECDLDFDGDVDSDDAQIYAGQYSKIDP